VIRLTEHPRVELCGDDVLGFERWVAIVEGVRLSVWARLMGQSAAALRSGS
jgi:hypothetical protein